MRRGGHPVYVGRKVAECGKVGIRSVEHRLPADTAQATLIDLIDREFDSFVRVLITYMMEDPRSISRILNVMNVLRSLERVGDHARNIAEQLIYMVQGIEARHTDYDEIERRLSQI